MQTRHGSQIQTRVCLPQNTLIRDQACLETYRKVPQIWEKLTTKAETNLFSKMLN